MVKIFACLRLCILIAAASLWTSSPTFAKSAPENVQKMAEQAYLYGLQQVIFYGQRWIYTQNEIKGNLSYSGVNRIFNIRKPLTPDSGFPVVTPNATTLYGTGFLDL